MSHQKSELYFLLMFLAGVAILTFYIFQPFLSALILAVIFATIFAPIYKKIFIVTHARAGISAFFATVLVFVAIVAPVALLSMQIFKEATALYSSLMDNGGATSILRGVEDVVRGLGVSYLPNNFFDFSQYLKQGLGFLIGHLDVVFSNVAKMMVGIFVFLIALYYLFKDGHTLKKSVIALSPLQDVYDETIFLKLERAINSVVRGSISVGLLHGVLVAVGLALFGVPNPVLFGSVAAIAALVPGAGTALVVVPSIVFLFFTGEATSAIGLFVWWVTEVGLVDNVFAPKLVGRGAQLHPLLILLSILGGIGLFGPLGFLFGPLALSLLFAFLEIYATIRGVRTNQ